MTHFPDANATQSLYKLSWTFAQDGKLAVDAATGIVVDANPAAEALMGYSRAELIGMEVTMLHPESERELVRVEFQKAMTDPAPHFDLHIQRKDGRCVPVAIWSSKKLESDGQSLVIGAFRDITDQVQREHKLSAQNWALSAYAVAALAIGGRHSSEDLLFQAICKAITHESNYRFAWVGIAEDGPGKPIRIAAAVANAAAGDAAADSMAEFLDGLHLSWSEDEPGGKGSAGICIRTNKTLVVQDAEKSSEYEPWLKHLKQYGIRSSVAVPFSVAGRVRGALIVYAARINTFESVAMEVFQHLAEQIGHGVHAIEQERRLLAEQKHLAEAELRLTEALSGMVAPIVLAMEMRDPYTAGHQSRVAEIAVAIGKEMGWPESRLQGLRVAAQVHDIGKISIPAEILTKPGRYTAPERSMVQVHPETAYTILKDIPFAWPIADIVRQHHEKLDGSGYPFGLSGDAILPEARILAVADIVEAMASDRPYRAALGLEAALAEIKGLAGTLLDAEVVRVCTALFREKRLSLQTGKPN
jgi:PAS domain S-box-containing protein